MPLQPFVRGKVSTARPVLLRNPLFWAQAGRTTGGNVTRSFPTGRVLTVRLDTFSVVGEIKGALLAFLRSSESSCRLALARPLRVVQPGFLDRSQWTGMKMHSCSYDGEKLGTSKKGWCAFKFCIFLIQESFQSSLRALSPRRRPSCRLPRC